MTVEQKRRELFERAWTKVTGAVPARYKQGMYISDQALIAWNAFNAALDAVEIELPRPFPSGFAGADEYADGIAECRESIESTGLGLKVLP